MRWIRLGREADNDIVLPLNMDGVSRYQVEVCWQSDGSMTIKDVGSSNGTFVNEARIQSVVIRHHDRVRFGRTPVDIFGLVSASFPPPQPHTPRPQQHTPWPQQHTPAPTPHAHTPTPTPYPHTPPGGVQHTPMPTPYPHTPPSGVQYAPAASASMSAAAPARKKGMPGIVKFLIVLGVLGALGGGGYYAYTHYVIGMSADEAATKMIELADNNPQLQGNLSEYEAGLEKLDPVTVELEKIAPTVEKVNEQAQHAPNIPGTNVKEAKAAISALNSACQFASNLRAAKQTIGTSATQYADGMRKIRANPNPDNVGATASAAESLSAALATVHSPINQITGAIKKVQDALSSIRRLPRVGKYIGKLQSGIGKLSYPVRLLDGMLEKDLTTLSGIASVSDGKRLY